MTGQERDLIAAYERELFDGSCRRIQTAYDQLGHSLDWRFINSPRRNLKASVPIVLVTLNPGGDRKYEGHVPESSEIGSAYIHESWRSGYPAGQAPLQLQVRKLFEMLASALGRPGEGDCLLEENLAAYFVPFRSPSIKKLHRRPESIEFARSLWTTIFDKVDPKLVITIDHVTTNNLLPIVASKADRRAAMDRRLVGWGRVTASIHSFEGDRGPYAVLRLPHLSRFKVFGREASDPKLRSIVDAAVTQAFAVRSPLR